MEELTDEEYELWKEIVIERLKQMPDNIRISLG